MENLDPQEPQTAPVAPPIMGAPDTETMIQNHIDSIEAKEGETDDNREDASTKEEPVEAKEGKEEASTREDPGKEGEEKQEAKAPDEAQKTEAKEENTEEPAAPLFTPELSYTFRGKKFEMPEELKGVIDSEEKQKFYEDVFSKAAGLEIVKAKGMEAEHNLNQMTQNLDQFYNHVNMGDFQKAFDLAEIKKPDLQQLARGFGFSKEDIIKHAYQLAQETPEQAQATSREIEADRRIQEAEMKAQQYEQQVQQDREMQVQQGFRQVFQDPEMLEIAQAYDQKFGEGKFIQECAMRGDQIHRISGRIEMPSTLVKEVVDRYNLRSLLQKPSESASVTSQPASNPKPRVPKEIPVIPAVEASGGSPGQRKIKSLDDIEKLYRAEYGEEL